MSEAYYRSAAWRRLRAAVLQRDVKCSTPGCYRASTVADHIKPRAQGGADALPNLRGLCASCHGRVTASADGGYGNTVHKRSKRRVALPGCDASGTPNDPGHWWNRD